MNYRDVQSEAFMAMPENRAFTEPLAGVGGHGFSFDMPARWTGQRGFQEYFF
jgi:hypothetical protein